MMLSQPSAFAHIAHDSFGPCMSRHTERHALCGLNPNAPLHDKRSRKEAARVVVDSPEDVSNLGKMARRVYKTQMRKDAEMLPPANYLGTFVNPAGASCRMQPEITEKGRMILVDWLVDVYSKFGLSSRTFALAMSLQDRYLERVQTPLQKLQLVGVVAMMLAAKYEEVWPPEIARWRDVAAKTYDIPTIVATERQFLTVLNFKVGGPTPLTFLERALHACRHEAGEAACPREFARLQTLSFMVYELASHRLCHSLKASEFGLAVISVARCALGMPAWSSTLSDVTELPQPNSVATEFVRSACRDVLSVQKLRSVRNKYANTKLVELLEGVLSFGIVEAP